MAFAAVLSEVRGISSLSPCSALHWRLLTTGVEAEENVSRSRDNLEESLAILALL
jgi:hypothetical protein